MNVLPEGTAALNTPEPVVTSTSTVGFPRESNIWRAMILFTLSIDFLLE